MYWLAVAAVEDWCRRDTAHGFAPSPRVVGATTAALAASHPVMTQAASYISARSELLYAAFFLAAILAGRRWMNDCASGRSGGTRWRWITVGLFALSLRRWAASLGTCAARTALSRSD